MEYNKRQTSYLKQKAYKMGIKYQEDEKGTGIKIDANADPKIAKMFLPTDEEKRLIANTQ
jgi:hypothetical protein